tara:strand:+ start:4261 stop:4680 length:420 start_codon:yes stop_codon:yes gene_type:complete
MFKFFKNLFCKKKYSIYVVEDDNFFLNAVRIQLEISFKYDADLQLFMSSDAILEQTIQPNAIIMDYHLGEHSECDGAELIRRLRTKFPTAKLIVLTHEGDIEIAQESYKLGVDNFIKKDVKAVKAVIQELVYNKDLQRK